jgi:hypothetical protein
MAALSGGGDLFVWFEVIVLVSIGWLGRMLCDALVDHIRYRRWREEQRDIRLGLKRGRIPSARVHGRGNVRIPVIESEEDPWGDKPMAQMPEEPPR